MLSTSRRLALVAAALVGTALAACRNPTAPAAAREANVSGQVNSSVAAAAGGFQGSVGYKP